MSDHYGSGTPDPSGSSGSSAWNGSNEPPRGTDPWAAGTPQESRPAEYGGSAYPESASGAPTPAPTYGEPPSYSAQPVGGAPYGQAGAPGQGHYPPGAYQGGYDGGQYGTGAPYGPGAGMPLSKGAAIAALVFGIIAFLLGLVPFLAAALGVVAVILGVVALRKVKNGTGAGRGLAIAGIVLGTLALLFNILWSVFIGGVVTEFADCMSLPSQSQQEQCITDKMEERGLDTSGIEESGTNRT